MINMFFKKLAVLVVLGLGMAACGDDDPITAVDRSTDCANICGKYGDCVGGDDFDEDECQDQCSDMKSDDDTSDIDQCEECVDDKSCVDSAFQCLSECAGIVP
jgi:hypothetical protein